MNLNLLIGRLTRDPELNNEGETPFVRFTIAVDRYSKNDDESADFIPCVAFGKSAGTIHDCFYKGRSISIQGHLKSSAYTDKDNKKRSSLSVVVDRWEFPQNDPKTNEHKASTNEPAPDDFEKVAEDVPF